MTLRVLAVGHSATRTGSPRILLNVLQWFKKENCFDVSVALLEGGDLLPEFMAVDPETTVLGLIDAILYWPLSEKVLGRLGLQRTRLQRRGNRLKSLLGDVSKYDVVYCNSAASLKVLPHDIRIPVVLHVHELESVLRASLPGSEFTLLETVPAHYVVASQAVAETLGRIAHVPLEKITVVPEFLDSGEAAFARNIEPRVLSTPPVVLACGTVEWRKGSDLFLQVAMAHRSLFPEAVVRWVWLGATPSEPQTQDFLAERQRCDLQSCMDIVPATADVMPWFSSCDVFLLTSREDPYPLVVLEAARAGKPAICFAGSGGMPEFLGRGTGVVVPYANVVEMAQQTQRLLTDRALRATLGASGRDLVASEHTVEHAGPRIREIIDRVSDLSRGRSRVDTH